MWLGAARHADVLVQRATLEAVSTMAKVLRLELDIWKSDRLGVRRFCKFIVVPTPWMNQVTKRHRSRAPTRRIC